jgi:homospermidine synthase
MTRAIEYLLKHQNNGLITTEEIPYKYMIDSCKNYLGLVICGEMNLNAEMI